MDWNSRILVINDASLAALVACVAAKEASVSVRPDNGPPPPRPVSWIPAGLSEARREAAGKIAHVYGLEAVFEPEASQSEAKAATIDVRESQMLVAAAYGAAHRGCPTVLWPAQPGQGRTTGQVDLTTIARIIDKALLVGRLCALDAEHHHLPSIHVEAPYADFTDEQMADLARDLDVKTSLCWWWEGDSSGEERARWNRAFEAIRTPIG